MFLGGDSEMIELKIEDWMTRNFCGDSLQIRDEGCAFLWDDKMVKCAMKWLWDDGYEV